MKRGCRISYESSEEHLPLVFEVFYRRDNTDSPSVTVGCSKAKRNPAQALQMVSTTRLNLSSLSSKAKVVISVH